MFHTADLHLIREGLSQLTETTYFSKRLDSYTLGLVEVIDHVFASPGVYPDPVVKYFTTIMWKAYKYLLGSVSKEIPYEMEYSLRFALKDWISRDCVITTALSDNEKDFHFLPLDPWVEVKRTISNFTYLKFDALLIQIALPKLYKNKPLFNIPLYHELGHFIDTALGVSDYSMLAHPVTPNSQIPNLSQIVLTHRREYFADLFASCYVGTANAAILQEIAGGHSASITHPATVDRIKVSQEFINGTSNPIVDLFQDTLAKLKAPALAIKYSKPDVERCFDDIRPYTIKDVPELHGMFEAGWIYLQAALKGSNPPWKDLGEGVIQKTVNDLMEKSIRNMSVLENWKYGITP